MVNCNCGINLFCSCSVPRFGLWAVLLLCLMVGPCPAFAADSDSGTSSGENFEKILAPLQTLHDDLVRIEAKLDSFANAKWEYKIIVPNVLGKSELDPYEPNLAPYGKEGWELITYSPDVGYILKRRVVSGSGK